MNSAVPRLNVDDALAEAEHLGTLAMMITAAAEQVNTTGSIAPLTASSSFCSNIFDSLGAKSGEVLRAGNGHYDISNFLSRHER